MSVLRLRAALLPRFRPASLAPQVRAVHSSVHGNDPNILSKEKARNLSGNQDTSAPHKEHAPGWNEHLASDSEANVKADQAGPSGKPGKELQDATVDPVSESCADDDPSLIAYTTTLDPTTPRPISLWSSFDFTITPSFPPSRLPAADTHKHHHSDSGPGPHVSPAPEPTISEEFVRADQGEKVGV
ncbi:hypothetical protein JCM24511_04477 [Saitozyma sp. JCM 24511]|nr:hypothetical protein JCM24511_04477 [Saitozyma sp. JCM 24511]